MKTRLLLTCCAGLALGTGCATNSGGTADESGVVSGTGYREFYYAEPEHRQYYWKEPWTAPSQPAYREYNYSVDPHKDYFGMRAPAVWKQPSPNGQDWTDARPEFLWYTR